MGYNIIKKGILLLCFLKYDSILFKSFFLMYGYWSFHFEGIYYGDDIFK